MLKKKKNLSQSFNNHPFLLKHTFKRSDVDYSKTASIRRWIWVDEVEVDISEGHVLPHACSAGSVGPRNNCFFLDRRFLDLIRCKGIVKSCCAPAVHVAWHRDYDHSVFWIPPLSFSRKIVDCTEIIVSCHFLSYCPQQL
jgi:hypothetical protein